MAAVHRCIDDCRHFLGDDAGWAERAADLGWDPHFARMKSGKVGAARAGMNGKASERTCPPASISELLLEADDADGWSPAVGRTLDSSAPPRFLWLPFLGRLESEYLQERIGQRIQARRNRSDSGGQFDEVGVSRRGAS